MTIDEKATDNNKVQIRNILVPIDGSECSLDAAKYATRIGKNENAQLFCIHVMTKVPYGYTDYPPAIDEYFKDIEEINQISIVVGPVMGLIFGGFLTTYLRWRSIFWIQ
jgi:peroxiredoxin